MPSEERISREELFFAAATLFGKRSTCPRGQVGAIAVRDYRIVASGYNGSPSGQPHCSDVGCDLSWWAETKYSPQEVHCLRAVHAEANVIAFAAKAGVALKDTTLFCTHQPCLHCGKLIINSGITAVHYDAEQVRNPDWNEQLYQAGVNVFAITP